MNDLAEFLLARIAEDEAIARTADPATGTWRSLDMCRETEEAHVVRWSPTRVLAECEAKRPTIERVCKVIWAIYGVRDEVLMQLATVYADHPGYRDEWRPAS
jgi:hypothetical protein